MAAGQRGLRGRRHRAADATADTAPTAPTARPASSYVLQGNVRAYRELPQVHHVAVRWGYLAVHAGL